MIIFGMTLGKWDGHTHGVFSDFGRYATHWQCAGSTSSYPGSMWIMRKSFFGGEIGFNH